MLIDSIIQIENSNHMELMLNFLILNFFQQQLSQFWYDETTKHLLSRLCSKLVLKRQKSMKVETVKVALLSCPSMFKSIKNVVQDSSSIVRLFEFDTRFSVFGEDFVHYDYRDLIKNEETLFKTFDKYFDIIFADPPFLSEECFESVTNIIKKIMKDDADLIVCSGKTMEKFLKNSLNLSKCDFQPGHQRNLANEFCSFANFNLDSLLKIS